MKQYEMFELEFKGEEPDGSFAQVPVEAVFSCNGAEKKVSGFYAGDGIYKVRFLPEQTGKYIWKVSGNVNGSGEEICSPAAEGAHGMVRTSGLHFEYQDGTKYLPFGTTVYALAHQPDELVEETMETLKKSPFNKVRHCVFPKHYKYNHNDPELYAFEKGADGKWDVHHPCMAFWDRFERILCRLGEMGIETDLILFHPYDRWGFSVMSMEENKVYLDYAIRRLAAYPFIWWSLANEYDLMFERTIEDWYEIENYVAEQDPYGHLIGNHNCVKLYDHSRKNITHACVQTSAMYKTADWQERWKKPLIYDECCYEGNIELTWGNISAFELVNRFWQGCAAGAYVTHGEVFLDDNDVIWWAKGGKLKGESVPRIRYLKKLLYSLPGYLEIWKEPGNMDPGDAGASVIRMLEQGRDIMGLIVPTQEEKDICDAKDTVYRGHIGNEVFLKYLARECAAVATMMLPEHAEYRIEMIDVWNMTSTVLKEKACGRTELQLPGKEGIALLAVKLQEQKQ